VTGPTQPATTSVRNASRQASRAGPAASSRAWTAGADVNVTASRRRVDRDLDDLGARQPQSSTELGLLIPVQLDGDDFTLYAPRHEMEQNLVAALRVRRPLVVQARGARRAPRFGAPSNQVRPGDDLPQSVAQSPAFGRFEPAAHADAGIGDDDVGRVHQAAPGRLAQVDVVGQRHDAQGRCDHDSGASAFQQCGQFVAPPVGGNAHREAGQFGHGAPISTMPSRTRT
jgi:hypothetical protein